MSKGQPAGILHGQELAPRFKAMVLKFQATVGTDESDAFALSLYVKVVELEFRLNFSGWWWGHLLSFGSSAVVGILGVRVCHDEIISRDDRT